MSKQLLTIGIIILILIVGYMIWSSQDQSVTTPPPSATNADLLETPGPDAPIQERQRHFELALSAARSSDLLDITSCQPDPTVLRTRNGATFRVKNGDSSEHILLFDPEHIYRIPAGSTLNIKADFGKGSGLYGYGCDLSSQASGLIFVE